MLRGNKEALVSALDPIRQGLAVDNYRLSVEDVTSERLRVRIDALEGACEECLAPRPVLKMIVSGEIDRAYEPEEIDVDYPTSVGH